MKKVLLSICCLTTAAAMSGCGTMSMPRGGVYPGLIANHVNYPSMREGPLVRYDFKGDQVQILGQVKARGESTNILGLFGSGDNGFGSLIEAAEAKYPGYDTIINVHWDTRYTMFNLLYLPIYQKAYSTVYGTAVKHK
jgi:hypothetical protein